MVPVTGELYNLHYSQHFPVVWYHCGSIGDRGTVCFCALCTLRQSNRAALLLGSVCSLSIMLRIVNAVLVNFGFGIYYTISIPFLAYGLGNCLANSLMVGVILCVFRNSNVMMEELERKTGIQTADIKRRETKTES